MRNKQEVCRPSHQSLEHPPVLFACSIPPTSALHGHRDQLVKLYPAAQTPLTPSFAEGRPYQAPRRERVRAVTAALMSPLRH